MADPWVPVDPLGEALHLLRMNGVFYCRSEMTAPWALDLPPLDRCLMFHVVTSGQCWLEGDGLEARLLEPGDLAVVPHGRGHRLASDRGLVAARLFDLPREQVSERFEILRLGGGGAPAQVVCTAVRFDHPAADHLVDLLPRVIVVPAWASPQAEWMQSTLRWMAAEAREVRPGGEAVVTRLADILLIQALRTWIAEDPAGGKGWLGALRDRQVGRAIALLHRDPGRPWTVASLAAAVAMSRSALAARFGELVGEPPMRYLARWRMQMALTQLQEQGVAVAELASRFGYDSEAAFSRAFKRLVGVSPGAARRRARGPADPAPRAQALPASSSRS